MLLSTIVGSRVNVAPTEATYPDVPWAGLKLWATKTANLHWGYYGGYQALWAGMKPYFEAIGIDLDTSYTTDDWTWWGRVWDVGWDKTHTGGGWDLTMLEWWLQPHSLVPWFESMIYGNMAPPEGFNIFHYNNPDVDKVLRRGMQESDALKKKDDIWDFQSKWMHDPQFADIYNPKIYEVMASYILGYSPQGCWWYDITHLTINATEFLANCVSADRRGIGYNTTIYAVSEDVWSLLPVYMDSYTEEQMRCPQFNCLYRWSIKDEKWQYYMDGGQVNNTDWAIVPDLAAADPIMLDEGMRARVPLRTNVYWSDGTPFTARDVEFTFNTTALNIACESTGYGDYIPQLKDVEYVDDHTVDFILQYAVPLNDLKSCLANDWGGGTIVPFHVLGKHMDNPGNMKHDKSNTDFANPSSWIPVTGPYKMVEIDPGNFIRFEKNPLSFYWDMEWGPYNIDTIIFKWVPNAETRLLELQSNDVDFGEYPTGSVATFEAMMEQDNLRVSQYDYPATNGVWFNLDHPTLSNRYVRQGIAHCIDYGFLISNILPSWGIETAYRGTSWILDFHWYDDGVNRVHLYNEDTDPDFPCPSFQYHAAHALEYMKMWWYAKDDEDYTLGPKGDANFDGRVDMDDYYEWIKWYGKQTHQIEFLPGQDVDPDFNNDGWMLTDDFPHWAERFGFYYPENSTTKIWSR